MNSDTDINLAAYIAAIAMIKIIKDEYLARDSNDNNLDDSETPAQLKFA